MNMSTWSIRHPVPAIALFMVLCVIGMVAFKQLPVTRFPNIDLPIITVGISQAGAAPSELITQVTKPVEDAIASIAGVKHITSVASDSYSSTTIEFELSADSDRALNAVKDALAKVRGDLPQSITEPVVQRLDVTGMPIMTYAVTDPTRSIEDLSYFVDTVIARRLQTAQGVGQVSRKGGAEREIKVELDPDRLLALGVTAAEVSSQLRSTNVNLGGGRGDLGGQEFTIRALGSVTTVEALAQTSLSLSNGSTVRLADLGKVIDGAAETRSFAMLDGQPVVAISILRATGASDMVAAEGVKERVAELSKEYPNTRLTMIDDTTVYTEGNFESSMETLYEGAALAIIVVLVFLRNWRATLITAVALPLSIIPTFFAMQWLGFSLNTISLLGITLVTGILVDDAIVEIENIVRHIKMGKTAYAASEEAASEIGLTVIAISFTIVAVFAPVSFMDGIAGQYFKQFGLTVAIAVLFSLLVARLITPMMAAYLLRDEPGHVEKTGDGFIMRHYLDILRWTLAHRAITLSAGLVIFVVSIFSATLLPTDFVPVSDEGRSLLTLELPAGSTLEDTRAVSRLVSGRIKQVEEVNSVYVDGGSGDVSEARLTINYGPKEERERSAFELEDVLRQGLTDVPDVKLHVLAPNGQRDVNLIVLGDTEAAVSEAADKLAADMGKLPQLKDVTTAAVVSKPEIRITPKPELAAQLGITASSVASTIRVATLGDSGSNLAKFNAGDQQVPIVVRMREDVRRNLMKMAGQRIPSSSGKSVPLGVVADIAFAEGPSSLERYDRRNRTSVAADLADGAILGPALESVYATESAKNMPEGTAIQSGGDAEVMAEVFTGFALAMGLGIMLVYVVLVILFDSFVSPVTILLSLPLSIGGAIFALFLFDKPISLPVFIGFLMLMGIVTKNAIMLVEFAIHGISNGLDRHEAMLEAGHKRARPIVMTTIAMVAGMVPSALALGVGGEFRSPMAIAVIGGLLVSTLLSLLFVPSLFSVVSSLKQRLRGMLPGGKVATLPINQP
ncbi:efflux RND transporter permease subunit [Thiothrix litoralis]|uniref:Efflux RND transporter permease subunit n=1 Tax=Thiothrix litoralis TaxID=2891210 RepID=A0ABX7WVV8_9GAMM|nr:efflux RND transporter permease subunit [Thiothrix litoralis]QTR46518.1 efflux RND transporter permease subunit [Thiothrix litoralis]